MVRTKKKKKYKVIVESFDSESEEDDTLDESSLESDFDTRSLSTRACFMETAGYGLNADRLKIELRKRRRDLVNEDMKMWMVKGEDRGKADIKFQSHFN